MSVDKSFTENLMRLERREPPLFEWREQLEDAEIIISLLKEPIPPMIGSRRKKPSPGIDLSKHREDLARFLAELAESYLLACDDFEMRNDPNKPSRMLEENWKDDPSDPQRDYGEYANFEPDFDWDTTWNEWYARGVGNPGRNRTMTRRENERPPVQPLHRVYQPIANWWRTATGGGFSPTFAKPKTADAECEPFERNNSPARFLILVAQYLDERYDPANARSVFDSVKRKEQKRKAVSANATHGQNDK